MTAARVLAAWPAAAAAAPDDAPAPATLAARTVVSVCDCSAAAINAAWRAAMVARELGASLRLLCPHDAAEPSSPRQGAWELRDEIRQRMSVAMEVEAVRGDVLAAGVAAARGAAVLVVPTRRGNPLREWIMGTQTERLIRLCRTPVLVVKRSALSSYRRVLVGMELSACGTQAVEMAAALSRGTVDVVHAVPAAGAAAARAAGPSALVVQAWREHRGRQAGLAMHELLAGIAGRTCGLRTAVEFGDPAEVVLARADACASELVVIGKRRRGLLADYLLGRVTQRVLAKAAADILVLPAARGCTWPG